MTDFYGLYIIQVWCLTYFCFEHKKQKNNKKRKQFLCVTRYQQSELPRADLKESVRSGIWFTTIILIV